ncbi:hypothetical protein MesoLj113b_72520 (plasmid) [Mesorhizobium sp. 113-3-3]|nr:hypothetical protein MesoLj113b_72520 [Mesorhizobium sp. 113-3-3]
MIDGHQRVMGGVGRTTKRIGDQNDAIADIDRAKNGREDADIGFAVAGGVNAGSGGSKSTISGPTASIVIDAQRS